MLTLRLFGAPQVALDGRDIHLPRRKGIALLAYLAVTRARHERDELAALFWPEQGEARAHNHLRRTLYSVRCALPGTWPQASGSTLALPIGNEIWCDVVSFRDAATTHLEQARRGDQAALAALEQAANLYSGDFLAGFTLRDAPLFDAWQRSQTESLCGEFGITLDALAAGLAVQGQYASAIRHAQRRLSLDPLDETALRALMQLYVLKGQISAACHCYGLFMRNLDEQLGIAPDPATVALYVTARQQRIAHSAGIDDVADAAGVPPCIRSLSVPTMAEAPPFVARERVLETLSDRLHQALSGHGQLVFLKGEAGSGKTTLARVFAERAQAENAGLLVAAGSCSALDGVGDPYQPLAEITQTLACLLRPAWNAGWISCENARRLWKAAPFAFELLAEDSNSLASAFGFSEQALATARSHPGVSAQTLERLKSATQRNGRPIGAANCLCDKLTAFLTALAARTPLLLVVDDLQWADPWTLGFLFHLVRHLDGSRILVLATYRSEDVTGDVADRLHALIELILENQRRHGFSTFSLDTEHPAEGRLFVDALLDAEPNELDEDFRQKLFWRSGGHALFTVEVLHYMREHGQIVRNQQGKWCATEFVDWSAYPPRVDAVIARRMAHLPADLHRLLEIASVEGDSFTAEVVAAVAGVDEHIVVRDLASAAEKTHRLVSAAGQRRIGKRVFSLYQFRHGLLRQHLVGQLDEFERQHLHQAIALAVAAIYSGI
jgi:DNA-binding SARP family transcriptional activator